MVCAICQREIPLGLSECPHCAGSEAAKPVTDDPLGLPVAGVVPGATNRQDGDHDALLVGVSLILFLLVIFVSYWTAIGWSGVWSAETAGYALGHSLADVGLSLLAVFLYYKARAREPRGPKRLLAVAVCSLVLAAVSVAGKHPTPGANEKDQMQKRMVTILKEAMGEMPPSRDHEWWEKLTREFFADVVAFRRQYAQEVASVDKTAFKKIYSPSSYASSDQIQEMLKEIQEILTTDQKYASLDPLFDRMRSRLKALNAPDPEKAAFLKGFEGSIQPILATRSKVIQEEKEWLEASTDLYKFVLTNKSAYVIRDKKLVFKNGALVKDFQEKQSRAIQLRRQFLEAKAGLETIRKESLGRIGLAPSDLDLPKNTSPTSR